MSRARRSTFYCSEPQCPRRWRNFRHPGRAVTARCPSCGSDATRLTRVQSGAGAYVLKDFPEHYNWSLGCVVKSRAHHQALLKARGLKEWEPTRDSPGSQLSLGRRH
jgi:hypothetical protein